MSLNTALTLFIEEFPRASSESFGGNPVADFVRQEVPAAIRAAIGSNDRYIVEGSPGKGNWTCVPWAAIFDRFITETAQEGYYLVYLVPEDFSGIYLSLNQGVTTIKRQYGVDARHALATRAQDFLARIGEISACIIKGPIDLRLSKKSRLASLYEPGAICSVFYEKDEIPSDKVLISDLKLFLDYYYKLALSESALHEQANTEEDETDLEWEDLRKLRIHKRVERNKSLAAKVKKHLGFTCQACGFNFEAVYGPLGRNYIEAHHLTPVSDLRGKRIALDPKADFAVLCSNCHRMIHKSEFVSDVEMFRTSFLRRRAT